MDFDVALEKDVKPVVTNVIEVQNEVAELVKVEPADPEVVSVGNAITKFVQNFDITKDSLNSIERIGDEVFGAVNNKSKILNTQIKEFQKNGAEGSPIAKQLILLESNILSIDPNNVDFEKKSIISKIFSPIKKYFEKFETVNGVITNIVSELDKGAKQLQQDNVVMEEDSKNMIKLIKTLSKQINTISYAKENIEQYVASLTDQEKKNFIESEILFTLSQKIIDMETLKNVSMQAVMSFGVLIRNNKELIRQVSRTKNITIFALQNSIVICKALIDQKAVMAATEAVSNTTNKLIADAASKLKQQGAEIHKQATNSVVDVNVLKQAFADITGAIEDIKTYRQQALPQMDSIIKEFDTLSKQADQALQISENRVINK